MGKKKKKVKNLEPEEKEWQDPMISGFGGHYGRLSEFVPKKRRPKKRSLRK